MLSAMQIEIRLTSEITNLEWESYTTAFNQVFEKTVTINYFKHKYYNTIDTHSYHVFLQSEDGVVGAVTVIPYEYYFDNEIRRVGLAVDVFILPEFRTDPLALLNMYKLLKAQLILKNIALVIAVPNDIAYPYWKHVVKWKDIGFLQYYTLPLKIASVTTKLPNFFNAFSFIYANIMLFLSRFISTTERDNKISINRSHKIIEKQRYTEDHIELSFDNTYVSYRIVNEDGIKTTYLIDFYNIQKGCKDAVSLLQAIKKIIATETTDIIVFIGKLNFFQLLMIRLPFHFEPKHLYFTADVIIPEMIDDKMILNINNWDFGLFNYDVR
jgi:hypothetical protein